MHKKRILFAEDEAISGELIYDFLTMKGYAVQWVQDGTKAKHILQSDKRFDLALLDIMLPEVSGMELLKYIRQIPDLAKLPVIFLTAKDRDMDELHGLESGADDYIRKPSQLNLIAARIENLIKRKPMNQGSEIHLGPLSINFETHTVLLHGHALRLTLSEFEIIALFCRYPNKIFSRQDIITNLSNDNGKEIFDRTIDVHIKNLRLKLGTAGKLIKTIRGVGYGIDSTYTQS